MFKIRTINEEDIVTVAHMEAEISKISFAEEAVTDIEFHCKRIRKSMEKDIKGMLILESDGVIAGWLWMDKKTNFITNDVYINFRSFYIVEAFRGEDEINDFLQAGIQFAKDMDAKSIVGKVHVKNVPMRYIYKNNGFEPTHITMEMTL